MAKDRQPFIGEIVPFTSPSDPEVEFGLRRLNERGIMEYRDKDATVRYIMRDETNEIVTEKDYPMGSRRLDVVRLGLATWNITNSGRPVEITEDSILRFLDPDGGELDAIYEEIMRINPRLSGDAQRKNASSTSSAPSLTPSTKD